jgi:hypothetical protein
MFAVSTPPLKNYRPDNKEDHRNEKVSETKEPTIFLKYQL